MSCRLTFYYRGQLGLAFSFFSPLSHLSNIRFSLPPIRNKKKKRERKPPRRARMSERSTLGRWHHAAGWYRDSGHWYNAWHPALMPSQFLPSEPLPSPALPPTCCFLGQIRSILGSPCSSYQRSSWQLRAPAKPRKAPQEAQRPMIKIALPDSFVEG